MYIKNEGYEKITSLSKKSQKPETETLKWDSKYDGNEADISISSVSKEGKKGKLHMKIDNDNLAKLFSVPTVEIPIEDRLTSELSSIRSPIFSSPPTPTLTPMSEPQHKEANLSPTLSLPTSKKSTKKSIQSSLSKKQTQKNRINQISLIPEEDKDKNVLNMYERIPEEFLTVTPKNPNFDLHHFKIPFRAVVVAPSGSGKTNFVVNLIHLFSEGEGTFNDITIITKDASEPLYRYIASLSPSIKVKEGLEFLPPLSKFDKNVNHLVVIDDMQLEKDQKSIEEYYIRCRKKNVSILYLAQNYYQIPIVVRNNCNYLIMLKIGSQRELNAILKEQGLGISKEQMLKMYNYATNKKFSPFIVDVEATDNTQKYRKGFSQYLNPDEY